MQGSSTRRDLNSFPPFRADEMVESPFKKRDGTRSYAYYPVFGGRLRVARERFPDLRIETKIVEFKLREYAVVHATVEATIGIETASGRIERTTRSCGVGTADKAGDALLEDSLTEFAETRAVSRALRGLGIGTEFNGAEEMVRDRIVQERMQPDEPAGAPFVAALNSVTHQVPPPAAVPAGKAKRDALGAKLWAQCSSDGARYRAVLGAIIPGRTSVNDLAELELEIVDLVVERAVVCESIAAVTATKSALQDLIGAKTPVESWTEKHVLMARAKLRPNGGMVPAPGHSASGDEHAPKF